MMAWAIGIGVAGGIILALGYGLLLGYLFNPEQK